MIKRTLCIETPCHLKCSNQQLIVSYAHVKGLEDRADKTVPIEDIGMLVLEHQQITLSHYLLDKLVANNTAVITCNETHHPSGLLMPLESNTLQSERFKAQIEATEPLKKQLWQQTVKAKIQNQSKVLKKYNIQNNYLVNAAQNVKSGDADNDEAKAAAYYWSHLFPPAWQFFRKREGPPPNNLLNYGYAILRATIARAVAGAGLLPTLGIFHRNRYNAYCLADDIMEPYRPFVDVIVRSVIDKTSGIETLTKEHKALLLTLPTVDVMLDKETSPLMIATQRTAASLAQCYLGESRKILYPAFPETQI
ncbi:MAG: type II CRISPR-associated endonuclease Cas1 [Bacteroidetes bacterium]|nr:type II CRISPR-associated endonuclease Cas1 [Bacteroidota bacterium]MBS1671387.1 type II CRISPR-associated endonuclease Cas1 [Bacteroidota bacterium]